MTEPSATQERYPELQRRLAAIVGAGNLLSDEADVAPYLEEQRGLYHGRTPFVLRPGSTAEVAAVVALCAEAGVAMVPQGGNTGLVGGATPSESGEEVMINLSRLNRIRELDAENFTITAEAGCILQQIQDAAAAADRLFPLSLGAEGSCQIGGNLSTNAGGVQVLRYGNMRELVLGLEVVLPDGRVWNGLRGLRKDNTGYDLKQLFIGAEGTLGIITAAVLKLYARPKEVVTALVALGDPAAAVTLLARLRGASGESVTSFELMSRLGLTFACRHVPGCVDPFAEPQSWYVLIELFGGRAEGGLQGILEETLAEAYEDGLLADATIAESEARRQDIWRLREGIVAGQGPEGGSIKHDISVPVSAIPRFLEEASAAVEALVPGCRPVPFGHLGDGNLHFNVSQPAGAERTAYMARWGEMNRAVHEIVRAHGGSISAEHGLGRLKAAENRHFKSPVELDLMHAVKAALDPRGLMNPGKVL